MRVGTIHEFDNATSIAGKDPKRNVGRHQFPRWEMSMLEQVILVWCAIWGNLIYVSVLVVRIIGFATGSALLFLYATVM